MMYVCNQVEKDSTIPGRARGTAVDHPPRLHHPAYLNRISELVLNHGYTQKYTHTHTHTIQTTTAAGRKTYLKKIDTCKEVLPLRSFDLMAVAWASCSTNPNKPLFILIYNILHQDIVFRHIAQLAVLLCIFL